MKTVKIENGPKNDFRQKIKIKIDRRAFFNKTLGYRETENGAKN